MSDLIHKIMDCLLDETTPKSHETDAKLLRSFFAKRSANDHTVAAKILSSILAIALRDGCISEFQEDVLISLIKSLDEKVLAKNEEPSNASVGEAPDAQPLVVDAVKKSDSTCSNDLPKAADTYSDSVASVKSEAPKFDMTQGGAHALESASLEPSTQESKDKLHLDQPNVAVLSSIAGNAQRVNGEGHVNGTPTLEGQSRRLRPHEWRKPIPPEELQRMATAQASDRAPDTAGAPKRSTSNYLVKDDSVSMATWGAKTPPSKSENGGGPNSQKQTPRPSESASQVQSPSTPRYTPDIYQNIRDHTLKPGDSIW
ncbi:hypothetical protein Hte_001163 [Hypoxylon texense]